MNSALRSKLSRYALALSAVVVATGVLVVLRDRVNVTTVALAFLLVILFVAAFLGSRPALAASLGAMLAFNYCFLPPYGAFAITDPQNWVALTAFLITALTAGQLSARARERATIAEQKGREVARLYAELQTAFEQASRAEALRQSERLKSALLDAVTHDIRTPLTSIKAAVTTLLDRKWTNDAARQLDDATRDELLEIIDEEADRLDRFVAALVDLARIEAGELHLHRRWGAADEIVTASLDRAEKITRDHRIDVEIEADLPLVRVDPRLVSEVLYNLIENAAKYSPAGSSIRVTAAAQVGDDGDAAVRIAVEDEGEGVPANLRERVFDKFFRATRLDVDASGYQPTGSGMGLAIARGITEVHGGAIWIEDATESRTGARFVFTLPIGEVPEEGDRDTPAERNTKSTPINL